MKTFVIPFFIPEEACPNRCIYCNQHAITGESYKFETKVLKDKIEQYLETIPKGNTIEVGFFGGNFTGISSERQLQLLEIVQPYIKNKSIKSIKLSTRPDFIDYEILTFLKKYNVSCIELGAQSLDDEVLQYVKRGHTSQQVVDASKLIKDFGFDLGLQMMIGLPKDSPSKSVRTAIEFIKLKADCTRIYPTLVIKDTELEKQYLSGLYKPLTLQEAVNQSAEIAEIFIEANVKILRIGLHPSTDLINNTGYVAGPFHVAFGELVYAKIWNNKFRNLLDKNFKNVIISIPKGSINAVVGHRQENKKMLLEKFSTVAFKFDENLNNFEYYADFH